jgi:transposase
VQRNILHSLTDRVFPEYGGIFKKLEGKASLHILKRYTTPERIKKAGLSRIAQAIRRASRGKLTDSTAKSLVEAASKTIGLREAIEAIVFAIKNTVSNIERIQEEIVSVEKELTKVFLKIPYSNKLLSIPGAGVISLSVILGESGDLYRYERAEELIKLAGLNLFEISSGNHHGRRHITKRGRPMLRKYAFFIALRAVKTGGAFREKYLELTEKNQMQKTKALVAISKKFLRVLFALARDGVVYQQATLKLAA